VLSEMLARKAVREMRARDFRALCFIMVAAAAPAPAADVL
jgi:hypothetical protein